MRKNPLARAVRALLHERFPDCFAGQGEEKPPLKIGIDRDILGAFPELGRRQLEVALLDYAHGPTYARNVIAGASRIGLNGEGCGYVTATEAAYAAGRMRALFGDKKANSQTQPEPLSREAGEGEGGGEAEAA